MQQAWKLMQQVLALERVYQGWLHQQIYSLKR
jgi:hypothetical protein